ncbi:MAG: glycosyltransferase [Lachnospiraceae bacterium]|jgi:glycosyltransferase involved in cell wall biosynthesis|nr:glycosyltransferase [Lachnospiraceae bacterium]
MESLIPISVCMIAKNEEQYLDECLRLLSPYGLEIVVVDTGSTDQTVDIAHRYTNNVFHFDWCNDFSAARNFSITHATHDWVLILDCDELLEDIDRVTIDQLIRLHPQGAGMMLRRNPYTSSGNPNGIMTERVARLFSRQEYHYRGIIHEQIARIDGSAPDYFSIPLDCNHVGYITPETATLKATRNLELLLAELQTNGPHPYTYYQIGKSYTVLHNHEKACYYFDQGLSFDLDPRLEYVQTMVESYGYALLAAKRYHEALNLENVYAEFATRADFPFLMGLIYMNNGLFDQAITEFQKATSFKNYSVEGVSSYSAFYNIGVIYECTDRPVEAQKYYRKCGDFPLAQSRLHDLNL